MTSQSAALELIYALFPKSNSHISVLFPIAASARKECPV